MQMLIKNAKLRDREELVNILIDGGKIVEIGAGLTAEAETVIDAEGNLTTASYIDPHIHLDKVNVLDVLHVKIYVQSNVSPCNQMILTHYIQ